MSVKLIVHTPKDFEYPPKYDYNSCEECLFCHCDTYEPINFCIIKGSEKCPFYDNDEAEFFYECE